MALDDDRDLLDMAPVIALDALAPDERDEVTARLDDAAPETVERFTTDLRDARETLAQMSAATATEPPAGLRGRVLALVAAESATDRPAEHGGAENSGPDIGNSSTDVISLDERRRQSRRRNFLLAAAVAVVVALGGVVVANQWTQTTDSPLAERVLAAEDVRTTTGTLEGGGVVTVVFSEDAGAGVLVMNNDRSARGHLGRHRPGIQCGTRRWIHRADVDIRRTATGLTRCHLRSATTTVASDSSEKSTRGRYPACVSIFSAAGA